MNKKKYNKRRLGNSFSTNSLYDLLLITFEENRGKKLNYKQLSKILNIKKTSVKTLLISVLEKMVSNGVIKEFSRGSYFLFEKKSIVSIIKNVSAGGVFANIDSKNEVFISRDSSCFACVGDEVEIILFNKKRSKQTGVVSKVLKRKKNSFVGVVDSSSSNYFLIPDNKKVPFDIFIPPKTIKKSYLDKKVLVRVDCWDVKNKNPVGSIVKVLGKIGETDGEINSILYDYGLPPSFSKSVLASSKKIIKKIPSSEIKKRLDYRNVPTFTIDPEEAKDFDDALSVKKLKNNNLEVGVHIADVSFYVKPGSIIDQEAEKRATSVYLVDRVIPMLPEVLSNDLCSLKPNVDRLAYSVIFEITKEGCVVNYRITETVINSNIRFTYEGAQKIIDNKKGVLCEELLFLYETSKKLKKQRELSGSIGFVSSEVKFILNKKGDPVDVFFKKTLSTNYLIEEFMLLANKTVAKHIGFSKTKNLPFVYRIHDLPDNEKITVLSGIVKKLGYSIDNRSSKTLSLSLNLLLKNIKGQPEQQLVEVLVIRSMAKAIYSTNNIGHYGLGFDFYSHFTSPIRRYPDLIIHRMLKNYLIKNPNSNSGPLFLEKTCSYCSKKEKDASSAERDSIKYMQVKYLKTRVGECYEGFISGVTDWGFYVEIIKNKCEGLVKVSSLKDDHYVYNEKKQSLIGYQRKNCYQLGQKVKIKVYSADLERRQLDFILA